MAAPQEGQGIQVLVRVRPPNEREKQSNRFCVEVDESQRAVLLSSRADSKNLKFVYDQVSGRDGTQEGIFESVGKPMCESVLQGYNATIFAYGQTGAGKTFTMMGSGEGAMGENQGLIQRVFGHLFKRIAELEKGEGNIEVSCKCSYLEIYNEQVTDMLSEGSSGIVIRDDPKKGGIVVEGATNTVVKSSADTLSALSIGQQNRHVAATCMNKESSRSHSVFTLYLKTSAVRDGVTTRRFSRFNLIDLAGSERQKQTQATGDRLKEAMNINRSLSALGNVIMALANNNGHVPYRDSKLTFMLKDSIGGNSKTCIIACCSPAEACYDETLSTLKFVRFAKLVKNVAQINSEDSAGDVEAMRRKIARLEHLLREARARGDIQPEVRRASLGGGGEGVSEGRRVSLGGVWTGGGGGMDGVHEVEIGEAAGAGGGDVMRQLHKSLERESEARASASRELQDLKEKVEAHRNIQIAQDKALQATRMQVKLKEAYIAHLEKKALLSPPEQVALLRDEVEALKKQVTCHPETIRLSQNLREAAKRSEELEEQLEERGLQVLQADLKASKEDVDQLSDLLKTTLSGKSALEERVEQLMMELEDCKETVEHLNVVISEHEFLSSHTDSEHHQHAAALASKVKTLEASLEQHELSAAEHARAREQETEREREREREASEQSIKAKDAEVVQLKSALEAAAAAAEDLLRQHVAQLESSASAAAAAAECAAIGLASAEAKAAERGGAVERMVVELAAARDEAQVLRAELERQRERADAAAAAAEQAAAAAAEEVAASRTETDELRLQLAALQKNLVEASSAAQKQRESEEARLASERQSGEEKLKMVVEELRRVEGVKDDVEREQARAKSEMEARLASERQSGEEKLKMVVEELRRVEGVKNDVEREHARAQSEMEALRGRLQQGEQEREQLESARAAKEAACDQELEAKDLEIAALRAQAAAARQGGEQDSEDTQALREETAHLQAQVEELTNLRTGLEEAQVATLEEAAELKVRNRSLFIRNAHLEDTMAGVHSAIAKVAAALGIDVLGIDVPAPFVYSEEVLTTLVTSAETAAASGGKARALEEQLEAAAGAMEVSEEQRLEAQQAAQGLQEKLAAMEQKMAELQKALSAQHDAHTHVEAERVTLEGKLEAMVAQLATAREQLQMLSEQVEALGRDAGAGESEREQRLQKVQAQLALALASQESKSATVEALQREHKTTLAAAAALEAGKEAVEEELLLAKTRQREAEQLRDKALADLQKVKEALEKEQRKCKETTLLNKQLHKQFKKSFEDFLITSPQQQASGTPAKPYHKDTDSVLKVCATPKDKENSGEDAACGEDGASQSGGRKVLMQIENFKGSAALRGPTPAKGRPSVEACRKGIISFAELSDGAENQGSGDTRVVSPVSFN